MRGDQGGWSPIGCALFILLMPFILVGMAIYTALRRLREEEEGGW